MSPEEKSFLEKRKYPRVSGSIIEYSYVNVDSVTITAFVKDISRGGVCIYVHEEIKPGTVLKLFIHLFGNEKPLETTGRVMWIRDSQFRKSYDVGIQFENLPFDIETKLHQYIAKLLGQEHPLPPIHEEILPNGVHEEYYNNGKILSTVTVINGKMEGIKKYYYPSGELLEELPFKNSLRHGVRKTYYRNGKLHLEQHFEKNKSISIRKLNIRGQIIYESNS